MSGTQGGVGVSATYGPSTVNRRRRSRAELAEVDDAIAKAVAEEHPVTLRGVYYRVVSAGAVDKTENDYRLVGRQFGLRAGEIGTAGPDPHRGPDLYGGPGPPLGRSARPAR